MEESDENETRQKNNYGPMPYELGATSQNFNDNSTLSHMQDIDSKDFFNWHNSIHSSIELN